MNQELLKMIERIAREKNIEAETVFEDLESAIYSAIRKSNLEEDEIAVQISRETGEIRAVVNDEPMSIEDLGRIAAQTAKQVMIQKIRESERGSIYDDFLTRKGEIVTGRVMRWEGGALVVSLDRVEAYLPKSEQIPGDSHQIDSRLRAMILDVRKQPGSVRVILSRTHPDFIRTLFDLEVPEVHEGIIMIDPVAREAGYRTKVAVRSLDPKVDAVGACVGIRGSRIKNIVDELGGEKIDIVRWNESSKVLIANALKPAEISEIALCFELGRATVVVSESQLSLAIGKRGQNVRLAARLTDWDVDILTPEEFNAGLDTLEKTLREIEGVDSTVLDQVSAMGMVSVMDVEEVGPEPLVQELGMAPELAEKIVIRCAEESKRVAEAKEKEKAARKAAKAAEAAEGEAAKAAVDGESAGGDESASSPVPAADAPAVDADEVDEKTTDGDAVEQEDTVTEEGGDTAEHVDPDTGESAGGAGGADTAGDSPVATEVAGPVADDAGGGGGDEPLNAEKDNGGDDTQE